MDGWMFITIKTFIVQHNTEGTQSVPTQTIFSVKMLLHHSQLFRGQMDLRVACHVTWDQNTMELSTAATHVTWSRDDTHGVLEARHPFDWHACFVDCPTVTDEGDRVWLLYHTQMHTDYRSIALFRCWRCKTNALSLLSWNRIWVPFICHRMHSITVFPNN